MISRMLALAATLWLVAQAPLFALQLGIDRAERTGFAELKGKRLGLITNQTGVNAAGVKTRQILARAKGVNLVALFTPEHGLDGTELAGRYVSTRKDPLTGLTAFSLYGPTRKPTPAMLKGLDALVFDLQDIGCRSYTYISTMARCMEAAGEAGIEFIVLDRPNPLGGQRVEGPSIESNWISFVGQLPVPYVHGMTCGELAKMLNAKGWISTRCRLTVIPMAGWSRSMTWSDTGLRWVRTSPNVPRADSPAYYVATGIVGSLSGLDIGVGGPQPFEYVTAPWLNGARFAEYLRGQGLSGIGIEPLAHGVRLSINPHASGDLCALALHLLSYTNAPAKPNLFARSSKDKLDIFYKVYGSQSIRSQLEKGVPAARIINGWNGFLSRFKSERKAFLLY